MHEPTLKAPGGRSYHIATRFGGIVGVWGPQARSEEYLGGYITEKALSIDNLVFVIILSSFRVPRRISRKSCWAS